MQGIEKDIKMVRNLISYYLHPFHLALHISAQDEWTHPDSRPESLAQRVYSQRGLAQVAVVNAQLRTLSSYVVLALAFVGFAVAAFPLGPGYPTAVAETLVVAVVAAGYAGFAV